MAGIDLNKYYETLIAGGTDPTEAAQIAAYQLIDNPSGSITKIKLPPKWYTQNEWYAYSAPDFLAAINYDGEDKLAQAARDLLAKPNTTLRDISELSRKAETINLLRGTSSGDYYNQLKDLYDQKESARKSYEKQLETHEFSQYGLPDPTLRYGLQEKTVGRYTYIPYKPAVEYVDKKVNNYYEKLLASGMDKETAQKRVALYKQGIATSVEKKLADSGYSPFLEKVAELRKIKN